MLSSPALWIEFLRRAHKAHSVIPTRQLNLSRRSSLFRLSGSNIPVTSRLQKAPGMRQIMVGVGPGMHLGARRRSRWFSFPLPSFAWALRVCYQLKMGCTLKFHTDLISKVSRTLLSWYEFLVTMKREHQLLKRQADKQAKARVSILKRRSGWTARHGVSSHAKIAWYEGKAKLRWLALRFYLIPNAASNSSGWLLLPLLLLLLWQLPRV